MGKGCGEEGERGKGCVEGRGERGVEGRERGEKGCVEGRGKGICRCEGGEGERVCVEGRETVILGQNYYCSEVGGSVGVSKTIS